MDDKNRNELSEEQLKDVTGGTAGLIKVECKKSDTVYLKVSETITYEGKITEGPIGNPDNPSFKVEFPDHPELNGFYPYSQLTPFSTSSGQLCFSIMHGRIK